MRLSTVLVPAIALLALAGSGCSDPVPPTAKGAWTVGFVSGGGQCMIAGHNTKVGDVTDHTMDSVHVDGGPEGASVTCSVTGNGNFVVDAQMIEHAANLEMHIDSISASASDSMPALGRVVYSSVNTAGNAYNSDAMTPCHFYFVKNTPEGIGAGKIWVAFTCPKVVEETSVCQIAQGYAIFENCTSE